MPSQVHSRRISRFSVGLGEVTPKGFKHAIRVYEVNWRVA